ncbi:hypothetical protein LINGRAHAP2_LOCUS8739 [Linum grandiflorum]
MAEKESQRTVDPKLKAVVNNSDEDDDNVEEKEGDLPTDLLSLGKLTLGPKKKLLIIPVGGFLCHRVFKYRKNRFRIPRTRTPDSSTGTFNVYKRPHVEDFIKFCLERFEVGIWHNMDDALACLIGRDLQQKLLFAWDQGQCTRTSFNCLDNKYKPIFLKELHDVFESEMLKSVKQSYSAADTILIGGDPYKALVNPPNTAIFLEEYTADKVYDNELGAGGKLRKYLDELAEADDVQTFVKEHPIGKPAISSTHPDWRFYSKIVDKVQESSIRPVFKPVFNTASAIITTAMAEEENQKTVDSKLKAIVNYSDDDDDNVQGKQGDIPTELLSLEKLSLGPQKKLLVITVGGFLCHRVLNLRKNKFRIPENRSPDSFTGTFNVYKRPHVEDFLKFCLERFHVGIWSSFSNRKNRDDPLACLIGRDLQQKLLFTWDQGHCTRTSLKCIENKYKPMFLKELHKVFESEILNSEKQSYSAANTILIETDPYKALVNPPNTAIFLREYTADMVSDDELGSGGELRKYLDELCEADDVQTFVKENPIGKPAISPAHPDWSFYSKIVDDYGKKMKNNLV